MNDKAASATDRFRAEVRARFGVLPNFFCTAASSPGLIEELWGFAKSAYLNSPLPSLFKERLFVQLSRFCEIRYCIIRHVGFLVGEGRPAGDGSVGPQTVEQAIALLRRPLPDSTQLNRSLARLESLKSPVSLPEGENELEAALFDALTILFIAPRGADRARSAVLHAVGERTFELLVAFLAFIRTAHYWTETHPALEIESDMRALMQSHPDLAGLLLSPHDSDWANSTKALRRALEELRTTSGALQVSEERYRMLVTTTHDILYRMNPDWSGMWTLDGRNQLADTTAFDTNWVRRYIPEDERERVTAAIQQAVAGERPFELEHRVLRADGSRGWVLSRAIPVMDDQGAVIEWFGTAIDLTARKTAEEALSIVDRRKDEFLATLAHELRNPLAPLRNGLQIARLHGSPGAPIVRTIDMMERQVNMLAHLVDDLLDVSRITSGKITLRRENVNLRTVLAASAEASRSIIDAHGHLLLICPSDEEMTVNGDFDRLTQVFSNLLSNAAKYTRDGGTIDLRQRREGDDAVVSVTDSGIGIPAESLSSIFDMFSQVRSHQNHAAGGLGIGLSLVRQLVEMHGGAVSASSPGLNAGSTFSVRLPLSICAEEPATASAQAYAKPNGKPARRILIVDDNQDAASSLTELLEQWGHTVATAFNGEDGLRKAANFRPDVALLDLGMPGMDGFEAASRLRALPGGAQMKLIAVTGWGQEHDRERTRAAGFDRHLLKPIDFAALELLLAQC
ncbi:ATP-binding protein [Paraburkholderia sp. J76]|uniref:hybrid sensor histidine kinase/response regulator n=1 Tax=Paraburkholderia sp. J76 TaxID=2805439 RepID=UPI002ABE38C3|nr:ATP-binding protein [Paraburkholderia sp. J76]